MTGLAPALFNAALAASAVVFAGSEAQAVRPDGPGAEQLVFHFDADDVVETYDPPGGRVRVHFTRAGDNAVRATDADEDGVPDEVALVGATYEEALAFYEDEGFRAPRSDEGTAGGDGGDGRFDVYLVDFGLAADGNFARERCSGSKCSGFMIQENDFAGYGYPSFGEATRVVGSHELFHAVQAAYDADQGANWSEATAVWATERFDKSLDDFEGFVDGWLDNPGRAIDQEPTGPVDSFSYGLGVVAQFFSERFGPELIRHVWEALEDGAGGDADPQWLAVLSRLLDEDHATTFAAAWIELATWAVRAGWTQADTWTGADRFPVVAKDVVTLPFQDDKLRVFHASLQVWSVKPGPRTTIATELVVTANEQDELEGMALVLAARDGTKFTVVTEAGPRTEISALGADEILVAVVNTQTTGESQRPGLCIGAPDEVAACKTALGGADPGVEPALEPPAEPLAEAPAEPTVEANVEAGPELTTKKTDDDGCVSGGLGLSLWLSLCAGLVVRINARRR